MGDWVGLDYPLPYNKLDGIGTERLVRVMQQSIP